MKKAKNKKTECACSGKDTPPPGLDVFSERKVYYFSWNTLDEKCGGWKLIRTSLKGLAGTKEEAILKGKEFMRNVKAKDKFARDFQIEESIYPFTELSNEEDGGKIESASSV